MFLGEPQMSSLGRPMADLKGRLGRSDRSQLNRNIWINTAHGALSVAALNLVQPFTGIFAVRSGATNFQVALLSSLPAVISLLGMIPVARLVDRFPRKKRVTALLMLAHRIFWLAMAAIPFFTPDRRAALLVAVVAIMNLPGSASTVAWQSLIARIIPPDRRAAAFATRNRVMQVVGTVMVVAAGRFLDIVQYPVGYQVVFALAFALGMAEIWVFSKLNEGAGEPFAAGGAPGGAPGALGGATGGVFGARPGTRSGASESATTTTASPVAAHGRRLLAAITEAGREIWAEKRFVRFAVASLLFYFMWQASWPVLTLGQVKKFGANNFWISMLNLTGTIGSLLGYFIWARLAERKGNLWALAMSSTGIFLVPVLYAFAHNIQQVALGGLFTEGFFAGLNLCLLNYLLEVAPERKRTSFIAYHTTAVNVSAMLAPMAGVAILTKLGFFWAFIVLAGIRVLGSLVLHALHVVENRSRPQVQAPTTLAAAR